MKSGIINVDFGIIQDDLFVLGLFGVDIEIYVDIWDLLVDKGVKLLIAY